MNKLFLLLVLVPGVLFAQGTSEYRQQLEGARHLIYTNPDSLLQLTDQILKNTPADSLELRIKAIQFSAQSNFYKGQYELAAEKLENGIKLVEQADTLIHLKAGIQKTLGAIYGARGDYPKSLLQFLEARKIFTQIGDHESVIATDNNIGITYIKFGDFEAALQIFLRLDSLQFQHAALKAAIPVNLTSIYYELGDYENAMIQANKAIGMYGEDDGRLAGLFYLIGNTHLARSEYDEAETAFKKALKFYQTQRNELSQVGSLVGLAHIELESGQISEAESYAQTALKLAKNYNGIPELTNSYEVLHKISASKSDTENALNYFKKFHQYSDSLNNIVNNERIARMLAEYEYSERERNLVLDQQQKQLTANAKLTRQRVISYSAFIIVVLAVIIILMMMKNARDRKKANKKLEARNKIIEEKADKLKDANNIKNRLFSIIAHDLRGPLGSLQGVLSLIEMNAASKEDLEEMLPLISKKFNNTSMMLTNLLHWSKAQMEGFRIEKSEFDISEVFKEKSDLLRYKLEEKNLDFDYPDEKLLVYADKNMIALVVQNLLSNAIKFSETGDCVYIETETNNTTATVTVRDCGIGISEEKVKLLFDQKFTTTEGTHGEQGTGLGLMLCKEFVEKNNGEIKAESILGKGTKIHFTLPLAH